MGRYRVKIYIDITNVLQVKFTTGIQRVVRNVVIQLINITNKQIILLCGNSKGDGFRVVNNEKFLSYNNENKEINNPSYMLEKSIIPEEIEAGDVFFDLDSAWNTAYRRSTLLSVLKSRGVRTAVYIYDIIPIRYPQFCHINTVFQFMDYIGAYLQYGDLLITSTRTVLDDVMKLKDEIGTNNIFIGDYSWLGSDFIYGNQILNENDNIVNDLKGRKYILYIGTVEPRKNIGFLLDAFDHKLSKTGLSIVIAGRIGWNVEDLVFRIKNHPLLSEQLFYYSDLSDIHIDYLYRNAVAVAFPTYDEGFGLPLVEAIERNVPVITTDKPVLREVGRDFADYFELNNEDDFCELVSKYVNDDDFRDSKIAKLKVYKQYTWKDTTYKILSLLNKLEPQNIQVNKTVKQIVILTARPSAIRRTLEYIDIYMPFIKEAVLCCPDFMENEMKKCYKGRLKIRVLSDSKVLGNKTLPDDHQARNTFLRSCAILGNELDDVFIMSDDDYRPLCEITKEYYVSDGKYNCYYCYDLDKWRPVEDNITSYDVGMKKTADFLKNNKFPTRQYSSHMPQIIDRRIYRQLLRDYPEVASSGFDEWSIYFNYLHAKYPNQTRTRVYQTICWPAYMSNWDMMYYPDKYTFENYYEDLYEKGKIFEGISNRYEKNDLDNAAEKIRRYHSEVIKYKKYRDVYKAFCETYAIEHKENPSFGLRMDANKLTIHHPKYFVLPAEGFLRVPFFIIREKIKSIMPIIINYGITNGDGNEMLYEIRKDIPDECDNFRLPMYGCGKRGEFLLKICVQVGMHSTSENIKVVCVNV